MDKDTTNLNRENWKAYALSLERQLNQLQINLRPPIARIKGLADLLLIGEIDSEEEKLEMVKAVTQQAKEMMGFLEELSQELDGKKAERNME